MMDRYSRQILLPEIGKEGQEKIANARVLVVGAGGLGCPALQYLAAAGVGKIGIVDPDIVDISNLQRQILYGTEDLGAPKATAAKKRLQELNPDITVTAFCEALTTENALGLFSGYDIVIDGTDNFGTKFLINDAAVKLGKTVVHGAIQGFDGHVSVFDATKGPCYRCLYPAPPTTAVQSCAEAGVIGALAGIVGTMQAMETIKAIIGGDALHLLTGKLLVIDARTMETRRIAFQKKADCPLCSKAASEIVLQGASPVCFAEAIEEVECGLTPPDAIFIDVRERHEWEEGHIEGARHVPLSALQKNPDIFTPPAGHRACIIYCQHGQRSRRATEILMAKGCRNVHSLRGGYAAWKTYATR